MSKQNQSIRLLARISGVPLRKISDALGIHEKTLYRWLRVPLTKDKEERIMSAIEEITKEG